MREFIVRVSDPVAIQWHLEEPETPELVRCKDCKHWDADEHNCNIKIGWFACSADWYCADGEWKDGNGDA